MSFSCMLLLEFEFFLLQSMIPFVVISLHLFQLIVHACQKFDPLLIIKILR